MTQTGLALGALRLLIHRFRPEWIAHIPWFAVTDASSGPVAGRMLRRPWWMTPLIMTISTTVTCYVVVGLARARFQFAHIGEGVVNAGPAPLYVALLLSLLGFLSGHRFNAAARPAMAAGFRVHYLPNDHAVAQRVHHLAAQLDLPPPAVGVTPAFNAFACGPNVHNAAVVIGIPLGKVLTRDELDAVIGHELGHVVSGDMRQMQFAEGFQRAFGQVFGIFSAVAVNVAASATRDRSAAMLVHSTGQSLHILERYLLALGGELLVKGLSRNREYHADAVGAALTSPEAMSSALEKVQAGPRESLSVEQEFGYLMFKGFSFGRLFSTHPTISARPAT